MRGNRIGSPHEIIITCELRKIAGWTAETPGGKLGITKQIISNLENQKVKLSRVQYIAIRSVFECEVAMSRDNTTLRKVMGVLFTAMPPVCQDRKDEIRTAMISIASIASAGTPFQILRRDDKE